MEHKEIYEIAVKTYGVDAQIGQYHEEVGELMKAINKHRREPSSITMANISEEIADNEIMSEQLKVIYGNAKEVAEIKEAKIKRLSQRLGIEPSQNNGGDI